MIPGMLTLLLVLIALGIIIETVTLKRDPSKIELNYALSRQLTEPGALFSVQVTIINNSRIPLSYLAIKEIYPPEADVPDNMVFAAKQDGLQTKRICRLGGRQRKKLLSETSIAKRGVHMLRCNSIEYGDFLGFRETSKSLSAQREIVVYPKRSESPDLTEALGRFCGDMAARRFLIRDPILTVGCREYTGREPMKEIHWLQSARLGNLMVREFDYNRQLSACVILSVEGLRQTDEETLDELCSAARTICETLAAGGVSVIFFTNAWLKRAEIRPVWRCEVSAGYTGAMLETLGRATTFNRAPLEALLEYARRENDPDAAFIVIAPATSENAEESINRLRAETGQEALLVKISGSNANPPS